MPTELFPGTLSNFNDSMAKSIEDALEDLIGPLPAAPPEVIADRRKFFIAIAEGVIRHLQAKEDAFEITVGIDSHAPVTVTPNIRARFT